MEIGVRSLEVLHCRAICYRSRINGVPLASLEAPGRGWQRREGRAALRLDWARDVEIKTSKAMASCVKTAPPTM